MDIPTIKAWPREERGTRACRRLRRRGLIPVVLYGRGDPNVLLTVKSTDLQHLLDEHNMILEVQWDGDATPAQLREVQRDPLGDEIAHADLGRISLTETVQVAVSVELHGEAPGVEEGGVLELVLHEVEVECLPSNIPENIRVEVGELNIGDDLRIGDLQFPEDVVPTENPDAVVVTCVPPMEMVEEAEEAVGEELMAEPEVIGKAAEEEEEEGAAATREEGEAPQPSQ